MTDNHTATQDRRGQDRKSFSAWPGAFQPMTSCRSRTYQIKAGVLIVMWKTNGERDTAVIWKDRTMTIYLFFWTAV